MSDAQEIEDLAQEFTDLRKDVIARLERLTSDLTSTSESDGANGRESADLPPISVNESIQVRNHHF